MDEDVRRLLDNFEKKIDDFEVDVSACKIAVHHLSKAVQSLAKAITTTSDIQNKIADVQKSIITRGLEDYCEIIDWASNNMNWNDVKDHAVKVSVKEVDFQEGWVNGEKEVITKEASK